MKPDDDTPDVPPASRNAEKDPDEWVTKEEPMTGPQRSYLQTLCREAGEEFDQNWTKAEAFIWQQVTMIEVTKIARERLQRSDRTSAFSKFCTES